MISKKQKKLIDISQEAIKNLSIKAINQGFKNFKRYAEHLLEMAAKEN